MKLLMFTLFFIFNASSLIQADEKKETNIIQKLDDMSPSVVLHVSEKGTMESVWYLSKKFYVRRKVRGMSIWADDNREKDCDYSKALPEGNNLGYSWHKYFCLEGSFQFQSEGSANYGFQVVIHF